MTHVEHPEGGPDGLRILDSDGGVILHNNSLLQVRSPWMHRIVISLLRIDGLRIDTPDLPIIGVNRSGLQEGEMSISPSKV